MNMLKKQIIDNAYEHATNIIKQYLEDRIQM